jgi:hypothetical protein
VVYVIFEGPGSPPPRLCLGPYESVQVSQGQLFITGLRGGQSERLCLAAEGAGGWHVREGPGAFTHAWESIRFSGAPEPAG